MKVTLLTFCLAIALLAHSAPPVSPTVLLVVGNTNLNSGDLAIKNRLQTLGFTVTVKSAASSVAADATGKNLIFLSSTVASGDVNTKFTQVAVPLINCENALFDDLEMTATSASNYGNLSSLKEIKIIDAGHPLAAGLPNGTVDVCTTLDGLTWGKPAAGAVKIATFTSDAQRVAIFGFEAGALMDGPVAPARRVGFFLDDDGATLLTAQGSLLLDAAITWAANVSAEPQNSAPTVSITTPENGATFLPGAHVVITATASDTDGSIAKVEFYEGSNLLGEDADGAYSFNWNNVAAGNYIVTAKATDNNGLTTTSAAVNITVAEEDTSDVPPAPVVKNALLIVGSTTLTPGDQAIKDRLEALGFAVTLKSGSASATNDAVGKNLIFVSSTITAADVDDKFTNSATPAIVCESGIFSDMKLTGGSGNYGSQTSENEVTITNTTHPLAAALSGTKAIYTKNDVVTWGKPVTGSIVAMMPGSTSKSTIFAYDAGATMQGMVAPERRVGFFLNDNGAALLTADGWQLFDAAVSWAANTSVVTPPNPPATNVPPAVSISSPANNADFTAPATVTISVNASDTDGTITKVEFYEGNNLIGTDVSSPYNFTWNNVAAGSYTLKAKATDNTGASTLSAAVNISVTEPSTEEPGDLPFTVSITEPQEQAFFLEGSTITVKAAVAATGTSQDPYLEVINSSSNSYRKMKLAYDDGAIYGANRNVAASGNNKIEITLRDFNGTAQWNKMQIKLNSSSKSPSSLQNYVNAVGGIGNEWRTITIPFADFPGFDFTKVQFIEFPSCKGANQFEIGIQKIVFTGGSTPFLWFGDSKTNNNHDGNGGSGQLIAELVAAMPVSLDKVEFYKGNSLLGTDHTSPYEFSWNDAPAGSHTLTARGYQSTQFVASAPVTVHVEETLGDTLKVVVTFDGTPSTYNVQKAALKYNKDFAYSYTMDDGSDDGYRIVYPMFKGGVSDFTNINYPGMFYTDGCGNNVAFKAGLAIHSKNSLGQDLHESRSTDNRITWDEVKEVHAAGWDILNHSLTHAANGANTPFVYQITENTAYIKLKTGIDLTHFVVPSGDERYVDPAFDNGMVAVYDQSGSGFYSSATQVDANLNLNRFKLKRHFIQNSSDNISNVADAIEEAAGLSVNGKHYWYNDATHNITSDYGGTLKYEVFEHYMNFVHDAYGKDGADNIWMAPLQEVYEYMAVKQGVALSSQLDGNQLEITLALNNVPDRLRRYALTLNISANKDFHDVTVNGTSNYCFTGTGNKKLINLDWTANHEERIFKTSPEMENTAEPASEGFNMQIAPNPVQDILKIRLHSAGDSKAYLALFDMLGKNVLNLTENLQEGSTQVSLDLTNQTPGVYFIKAWTNDGTERIEKFVKR